MHHSFVTKALEAIKPISNITGLAAGGSWIGNKLDEYSDIDLVLVTEQKTSDSPEQMYAYAAKLGKLLNAFTGEHVGEKRLLICMYDDPLIHVDIKFVTPEEFKERVEDPVVLWDRDGVLAQTIKDFPSVWPKLNYQWIEDRFWTWIHYASLKFGRGELFETIDFLSALRGMVLAPLMQIKNRQLPRGLRRVEQNFMTEDLDALKQTVPEYSRESIVKSARQSIAVYRGLRDVLFDQHVIRRTETEQKCVAYFEEIAKEAVSKE